MCERALTDLRGWRSDVTDLELGESLSRTVTLHWLAQTFKDHDVAGIDDYLRVVQLNATGECESLAE